MPASIKSHPMPAFLEMLSKAPLSLGPIVIGSALLSQRFTKWEDKVISIIVPSYNGLPTEVAFIIHGTVLGIFTCTQLAIKNIKHTGGSTNLVEDLKSSAITGGILGAIFLGIFPSIINNYCC